MIKGAKINNMDVKEIILNNNLIYKKEIIYDFSYPFILVTDSIVDFKDAIGNFSKDFKTKSLTCDSYKNPFGIISFIVPDNSKCTIDYSISADCSSNCGLLLTQKKYTSIGTYYIGDASYGNWLKVIKNKGTLKEYTGKTTINEAGTYYLIYACNFTGSSSSSQEIFNINNIKLTFI